MRGLIVAVSLLLAAALHVISLDKASNEMKMLPMVEDPSFILPSGLLKIAALEFRGLASDVFFLESMTFIGETQNRKETPKVKQWEWRWWTKLIDTATDLDPYFLDPYYYANAFLPWDAGNAEEANRILKKGSSYRDWDWILPFFIGFNDFYFLHDYNDAYEFLMEASRRPGGDPMYASIASRLAFRENRTETAIFFLEETARNIEEKNMKERFETRIQALRAVLVLERAVSEYKKKFGRNPATIEELINRKFLDRLPEDPYGGAYYLAKGGKIRTTSSQLDLFLSPFAKKIHQ